MARTQIKRLVLKLFTLFILVGALVMVSVGHTKAAKTECDPESRYICQTSDDGIWYEQCCVCAQRAVVETCQNQLSYHYYACTDECLPWY
jgi:hypothetical protein